MSREADNIGRFAVSVVQEGDFSCTAGFAGNKAERLQAPKDSVPVSGFLGSGKKIFSALIGWWRGVNNLDDYRKYLAHQKIHHPDCPVLSEAEFWREKWDSADTKPQARCC